MTVYAELLRAALAQAGESPDPTVEQLVSEAVARRSTLAWSGPAVSRLADQLAYDLVLIRLCARLGLDHHDLLGEAPAPTARRKIERALAATLRGQAIEVSGTKALTLLLEPPGAQDPRS